MKFIFGYPGGAALHIYDAIFRQKYVDLSIGMKKDYPQQMVIQELGKTWRCLFTSGPGEKCYNGF
ncbi:MAG: hypothetical protein CM15mP127_05850 [Gammaproteobacteria bacterium]|nr:MAG: hypothetical protein CM15mP127_05850 [Gammaproteobacteria bacterium]